MRRFLAVFSLLAIATSAAAQRKPVVFTHADTLRGSNGPARAWWDASFYDLHVAVSPNDSSIRGYNAITYRVLTPATEMQIDLQVPLEVDSMVQDAKQVTFRRDGNAFFVVARRAAARRHEEDDHRLLSRQAARGEASAVGRRLHLAARQPRQSMDLDGRRRTRRQRVVAEQGFAQRRARQPTRRDHRARSDDRRLERPSAQDDAQRRRHDDIRVVRREPINNYGIEVNAGQYAHFSDVFTGESGKLTVDYWPLAYHTDTAKVQFRQATSMLKCFEHWFGPYPWYKDGYKLIEAPHLGMEHQSGVAYGNKFKNGYSGRDLSGTGLGHEVGFHHRPRERARVVGQQHHGEGSGRHVDPRKLRELRRGDLRRVSGWEEGRRGVHHRQPSQHSRTTRRSSRRTV